MLLSTHRLCKEYRRGTTTCAVVNAVDFCLDAGDFISIVGRSGSGKTTFISMIAGLLAPTSGTILLDGVDLSGLDDEKMSAVRNAGISYIPQGFSLLPTLTAVDNIRLPLFLGAQKATADAGLEQAEELMEKNRNTPPAGRLPAKPVPGGNAQGGHCPCLAVQTTAAHCRRTDKRSGHADLC